MIIIQLLWTAGQRVRNVRYVSATLDWRFALRSRQQPNRHCTLIRKYLTFKYHYVYRTPGPRRWPWPSTVACGERGGERFVNWLQMQGVRLQTNQPSPFPNCTTNHPPTRRNIVHRLGNSICKLRNTLPLVDGGSWSLSWYFTPARLTWVRVLGYTLYRRPGVSTESCSLANSLHKLYPESIIIIIITQIIFATTFKNQLQWTYPTLIQAAVICATQSGRLYRWSGIMVVLIENVVVTCNEKEDKKVVY